MTIATLWTTVRSDLVIVLRTIVGLLMAVAAMYFEYLHLKAGLASAHFRESVLYMIIMCIGCGIAMPDALFKSTKNLAIIAIDVKKGGLRFTDKLADEVAMEDKDK